MRGQSFNGSGLAAAGVGSVHEFWMSSSAHRSPLFFTLLALLADTILYANSYVNSRSAQIVLLITSREGFAFGGWKLTAKGLRGFDRKIRIAPQEKFSLSLIARGPRLLLWPGREA